MAQYHKVGMELAPQLLATTTVGVLQGCDVDPASYTKEH